MMRSRAEVIALAERHGLGAHAERLAGRVRPGWRLVPVAEGGRSRIGGDPDLAPGEAWPRNHRGIAMTFLAQVDCSALPPTGEWTDPRPWRHGGALLRVFADLVDNPFDPGLATALLCDPGAPLTRTPAPPIPDPFPPGGEWDELGPADRVRALPGAPVRLEPFLTAPERDPEADDETYEQWALALRGGDPDGTPAPWELHHLLGEPASIQEDVRGVGAAIYGGDGWGLPVQTDPALDDEDAWRVLLALHFDESIGLHILDGGAYHVLAPVADLAAGRHDRLVCSVDSA